MTFVRPSYIAILRIAKLNESLRASIGHSVVFQSEPINLAALLFNIVRKVNTLA
jgi:hypothetical protein